MTLTPEPLQKSIKPLRSLKFLVPQSLQESSSLYRSSFSSSLLAKIGLLLCSIFLPLRICVLCFTRASVFPRPLQMSWSFLSKKNSHRAKEEAGDQEEEEERSKSRSFSPEM
ncbi:hypothetical protein VNO77_02355 [Canavalia gladiata]|uniref:Uncharacterized protein n=1 Tax=Canavalia gladiata TaxID=3824 RepID=A0AAN9MY39_CANGL